MKPKIIIFTIADKENEPYAKMFENSLRKFHSEDEVAYLLVDEDKVKSYNDPHFFYRAKSIIAKELIGKYDLIIGMDCDQIVTGSLDYLFTEQYDVGVVLNINREDPKKYGLVTTAGVQPNEYFNAGLIAMRNTKFIEHFYRLCHSKYFERFQYREQDLLNIICHFGEYEAICFDYYNPSKDYYAWHGLVSKGEWNKMIMRGDDMILPKGDDNYPDHELKIKVIHWAGGKEGKKMNYRTKFNEDCITRLDYLTS